MKRLLYENIMGARYHRYFKWYNRHWGIIEELALLRKYNDYSWPFSCHAGHLKKDVY
jgi:hypothetical protein